MNEVRETFPKVAVSNIDVAAEKEDKGMSSSEAKGKTARLVEIVIQDPVGDMFIAASIIAAHLDNYPLATMLFSGGMYHIYAIDKIQRRKEKLLIRAKDNPGLLRRLDNIHTNLDNGDASDKYTTWLYRNLRKQIIT